MAFLAQTQAVNSDTRYICELWKKSVMSTSKEYALLREIENQVTPKAFELIKNQASLFPKYHVSPFDVTKEGYYVKHHSTKGPNNNNMLTVSDGGNITYVAKETRIQIACLDKGLSEFTTVRFADASLKTCSCQYSQNYGLPCSHQVTDAYFCGLKSIPVVFVDEF